MIDGRSRRAPGFWVLTVGSGVGKTCRKGSVPKHLGWGRQRVWQVLLSAARASGAPSAGGVESVPRGTGAGVQRPEHSSHSPGQRAASALSDSGVEGGGRGHRSVASHRQASDGAAGTQQPVQLAGWSEARRKRAGLERR